MKMNTNLKIDTKLLSQEVEKIRKKRNRLQEIFEALKKDNEQLKDNWSSKASDVVYDNLNDFYKGYQEQLNNLQNDIDFLDALIEKYTDFEEKNYQEIDENIAI